MENLHEGVVLEVVGNIAKVRTSRHNDCANCGACPGNSAMVLEVRNDLGAKTGQRVMVEVRQDSMLKAAFIVYLLPLVAAFIGVMAGMVFAERLGDYDSWFQIGGGCIAILLSLAYIKYFDYHARTNATTQPVIIRIL